MATRPPFFTLFPWFFAQKQWCLCFEGKLKLNTSAAWLSDVFSCWYEKQKSKAVLTLSDKITIVYIEVDERTCTSVFFTCTDSRGHVEHRFLPRIHCCSLWRGVDGLNENERTRLGVTGLWRSLRTKHQTSICCCWRQVLPREQYNNNNSDDISKIIIVFFSC